MKKKPGTMTRAAALVLAGWFAVLTASVHGLHRHPWYDARSGRACPAHIAHRSVPDALSFHEHLDAGESHVFAKGTDFGYCPACLFLNQFNDRAAVWKAPTPVFVPDARPLHRNTFVTARDAVVPSSPRAPPAVQS